MQASTFLKHIERIHKQYYETSSIEKQELLKSLQRRRFNNPQDVYQFHELLCYLRAYPDNQNILDQVNRALAEFPLRSDVKRYRNKLISSGIAGTPIDYCFFSPMARWLVNKWPEHLFIDWNETENPEQLQLLLPLLVSYSEVDQLDEYYLPVKDWMHRLKGPAETDATFFKRRLDKINSNSFAQDILHDRLNIAFRLEPGTDTPSRTNLFYPPKLIHFQKTQLNRGRPNLRKFLTSQLFSVRYLSLKKGEELVDLARSTMVTHQRDLDGFSYGNKNDVLMIDTGNGLQIACLGIIPENRYLLHATYSFLFLKNGVPIGYFPLSIIFRTAEIAFSIFSGFRGAEAAYIFAKTIAVIHQLFEVDTFTLDPYQLGYGNKDGIKSGVWWFYYKLGFRPDDPEIKKLVRQELAHMNKNPRYHSSSQTLRKFSEDYMCFEISPKTSNKTIMPLLSNISSGISQYLAHEFGSNREKGIRQCATDAAKLLCLRSLQKLDNNERNSWERWSPLVLQLTGINRWSIANRRALAKIICAKGGRRESEFLRLFNQHRLLQTALVCFAESVEV